MFAGVVVFVFAGVVVFVFAGVVVFVFPGVVVLVCPGVLVLVFPGVLVLMLGVGSVLGVAGVLFHVSVGVVGTGRRDALPVTVDARKILDLDCRYRVDTIDAGKVFRLDGRDPLGGTLCVPGRSRSGCGSVIGPMVPDSGHMLCDLDVASCSRCDCDDPVTV